MFKVKIKFYIIDSLSKTLQFFIFGFLIVAGLRKQEQLQNKLDSNWFVESLPPRVLCGSFNGVSILPRWRGKLLLIRRKERIRKKLSHMFLKNEIEWRLLVILNPFCSNEVLTFLHHWCRRHYHEHSLPFHGLMNAYDYCHTFHKSSTLDSSFCKRSTPRCWPEKNQTSL